MARGSFLAAEGVSNDVLGCCARQGSKHSSAFDLL